MRHSTSSSSLLLSSLALLASATLSFAATHFVNPGESIQNKLNSAAAGDIVVARAGTHDHSGAITVNGRQLVGEKNASGTLLTTIRATDPTNASILLQGTNPKLKDCIIQSSYSGPVQHWEPGDPNNQRLTTDASAAVRVNNGPGFEIDNVTVNRGRSVGIQVRNTVSTSAVKGKINNVRVSDTLADGIHLTGASNFINVTNCRVSGVCDDGIAVVSYRFNADGTTKDVDVTKNIGINNNTILDTRHARGIAVVGGDHITITNNTITNAWRNGIYIVSESAYRSYHINAITVENNTMTDCNTPAQSGANGVNIAGRTDFKATNITFRNNVINNCGGDGINVGGNTDNIDLIDNRIDGTTDCGIELQGAKNVDIVKGSGTASIKNTGTFGVHVDANCSGAIVVRSIDFQRINTRTGAATNNNVIKFRNGSSMTPTIFGNRFTNAGGFPTGAYILCEDPDYTKPVNPINTTNITGKNSSPSDLSIVQQ